MNAIIESVNNWGARFVIFALPMLLQSAILIAFIFALDWALRKRVRATIRYAIWMLALVKLVLPPSLAMPTGAAYWLPAEKAEIHPAALLAPAGTADKTSVNSKYETAGAARVAIPWAGGSPGITWRAILFLGWFSVTLGLGIWVICRLRTALGVIRQSGDAPEAVRVLLESCRRQLGIRRVIPARYAAIGSPAICGVLRPVILIPAGLADHLDASEMRAVLLHELAHYKRGDPWVNLAQIFLQVAYWYNPLLWLANANIRRAREQAVDEMVLVEMGGKGQGYPATLLHVAKLGLARPMAALGLVGILEPGQALTRRILHIMNRPAPRTARIGAPGLAAVLLLALAGLPMAGRGKTEPAVLPAPVAADVKATPDGGLSPAEIFERARAKYASLSSYSDEGETVATLNGMTITTSFTIRLARPNLYRIEWTQNSDSAFSLLTTKSLQAVWSEGKGDFLEFAGKGVARQTNQGMALGAATGISGGASATIPGTFFRLNWGNQLGGPVASQKRQEDEKVGDADCYVFASGSEGRTRTLWIGKQDFLIHQVRDVTSAEVLTAALDDARKRNPGMSPTAAQSVTSVTSTETHTKIVVNQAFSPQDFVPAKAE